MAGMRIPMPGEVGGKLTGINPAMQGSEVVSHAGEIVAKGLQQLGAGVTSAADSLYGAALNEKKKHDQSEALDRFRALDDWSREYVDQGYLQAKGRSAIGALDNGLKEFDGAAKSLADTLNDKDQQDEFKRLVGAHRAGVARQLAHHEGQQLQAQDELSFKAGIDSLVSQASKSWNDEPALRALLRASADTVADRVHLEGGDQTVTTSRAREVVTRALAGAIANASAPGGNPVVAKALLAKYEDLIDGTVLPALQGKVEAADVREQTFTEVARIREVHKGVPDSIDQQVAWARSKIPDKRVAQAVEQQLVQLDSIDEKARAKRSAAAAADMIRGMDKAFEGKQLVELGESTPAWGVMSEEDRAKAQAHHLSLLKLSRQEDVEERRLSAEQRRQAAEDRRVSREQLAEVRADFAVLPLAQRATLDLDHAFPGVDPRNKKFLRVDQQRAIEEHAKATGVVGSDLHSVVLAQVDGMEGYGNSKEGKRAQGEFLTQITDRLATEFSDKKNPPTRSDVLKIVGEELVRGKTGVWSKTELWKAKRDRALGKVDKFEVLDQEDQPEVARLASQYIAGKDIFKDPSSAPGAPRTGPAPTGAPATPATPTSTPAAPGPATTPAPASTALAPKLKPMMPTTREAISRVLTKRLGKTPTDAQILDLYSRDPASYEAAP